MKTITVATRVGEKWKPRDSEAYNLGHVSQVGPFTITGLPELFNSTPHLKEPTSVEYHPIRFDDGEIGKVPERDGEYVFEDLFEPV